MNINSVTINGSISASGELSGHVQISGEPVLDSVTVKSTGVSQTITPEAGVDGYNSITVSPVVLEAATVKSTGVSQTITPEAGTDGFSSITVSPMSLQAKSVTPGACAITVTPDSGYDGLSSVSVGAASGGDFGLNFSISFNSPVPENMFMDMTNLTSVTFKVNSSNLSIGKWAFRGCTNLKRVEIPVCTGIGVNAFNGVTGHDLYVGASEPFGFNVIPLADSAYDIGEPAAIHCPPELVSVYKADAKWGVWSSIIVGDYDWPY